MYIIFGKVADQVTGLSIGKKLPDKRQAYAICLVVLEWQLMGHMSNFPILVTADGGLFLYAISAIASLVKSLQSPALL